jgi:hypothetical protein
MASTDRFSANTGYDNFYLETLIEDQFLTHLDLSRFFKVDNNLVGRPGMKVIVNTYRATDGTEKLKVTEGNTKAIAASMTPKEYEILLAQNRFIWYQEEELTDPNLIITGTRHMATDMFNTMNKDIIGELADEGIEEVTVTGTDYFSAFVDAQAKLGVEAIDAGAPATFAFVHPTDLAAVRKALKDDLKYVEAYSRAGYVGTVAGTNLYVTNAATAGTINLATADALTLFVKTGTEVEQERDANTRKNTAYSRKYYLAALTDATKAVNIKKA